MDKDLFLKIADECAEHRSEIHEVRFGNIAESTMGGEKNWWYIEEWVKRQNMVWFYSNMTYMDEKFQERLDSIGWNGRVIGHIEEGMGIDLERSRRNYDLAMQRWGSDRVRMVQPMTTVNGLRRWANDPEIESRRATKCTANRPFDTMIIGFDGRIQICCLDVKQEVVCGDLRTQSISEAWNGDGFRLARERLSRGQISLCNHCDWGEP